MVEVLSPSSERIDLGDKAAEYLRLPSLTAYLVFAQDEPKAWVWSGEPTRLPPAPAVIASHDKIVYIKELQVALPLAAVYAGTNADRQ